MYYAAIKKTDVANGPGVRVSLFVSGCTHGCKGCFNRETWDFQYGKEYTESAEQEILAALAPDYIRGLSVLGGEPMEIQNRGAVLGLLEKVRACYPQKSIWCYTGYDYEKDILGWEAQEKESGGSSAAQRGNAESFPGGRPGAAETRGSLEPAGAFGTVSRLLELIDVLVDGEFVEEKKNLRLAFRGSENQRLIDIKKSRQAGNVVCLDL